jgi:hypothetical protein
MIELEKIDSTYPIEKILPFCEASLGDSRPGAQNMSPIGWEEDPASFLYLLYKEKRYDGKGNGYVIYKKDDKILSGNGFSVSDIDEKMTQTGSRTYTIPGIKMPRVHGALNDYAIEDSMENGRFGSFSSVNEYNVKYILGYIALNDPKNHPGYFMENGKHFAKPGVRIHPTIQSAGPLRIRGVKQWIGYLIWNESHRESFLKTLESIKWNEA